MTIIVMINLCKKCTFIIGIIYLSSIFLKKDKSMKIRFIQILSTLLILIFYVSSLICQIEINYEPLKSFNPHDNFKDLASMDKYLSKPKLVGMGESTHGTHEFFQNRHRVFRYLVENYGFNTFFLEADYGNCLRVNKYINGEEDNLREVVKGIAMWPWVTEEMEALIKWMRGYNTEIKSGKKLQFIGCDMQRINSTIAEVDRLIAQYHSDLKDTMGYEEIVSEELGLDDDKFIHKYKSIVKEKKEELVNIDLTADDSFIAQTLIRHLEQIIEARERSNFYSYRDLKMAENILYHLEKDTSMKGFYWAHNGHIANFYSPKKKKDKSFYTAGGVLKNEMKDEYFIIGQEFDQGSFNAYHIPNFRYEEKINLEDINNYKLGVVFVDLNERELGYQFKDVPESILYFEPAQLSRKEALSLFVHNVGANYIPPRSIKDPSNMLLGTDVFDIIVLIKNTTATTLID